MVAPALSLTGRALRLLSQREHSRLELERKLAPYAQTPQELAQVLDTLHAKNFISEQRVLESVLHRRAAKLGATRIRQELQAKGLDPEAVRQAMDTLQGSELARAQAVWQKKFGTPAADAAERAKQMRFLASRGFGGDVVQRVVAGSQTEH